MANYIYLYGKGETITESGELKRFNHCYLQCEIPTNAIKCGFFPTVIHTYIMYAKDIGLEVTDVVYDKSFEDLINDQLVYSLWPLFYVNNSDVFTHEDQNGVGVWRAIDQRELNQFTENQYHVKLNTKYGYFYKEKWLIEPEKVFPLLDKASANPQPLPGNLVRSNTAWFLKLTDPRRAESKATPYGINKHYNELVVWNTLLDMTENTNRKPPKNKRVIYDNLKQATAQVLQAVVDRQYAYDALMPKWSPVWGDKPENYDTIRTSINNYNIGASLFSIDQPGHKDPMCHLLGTALNIKGSLKSGHAETRLLLTLDTVDFANRGPEENWFHDVCAFYDFELKQVNTSRIYKAYNNKYMSLISSLKPCYLCTGEVDATTDGFIQNINGKPVDMWACFPYLNYKPKISDVLYFDIDRPIGYSSRVNTRITVDETPDFDWSIYLVPWAQWTSFLYRVPDKQLLFTDPIGPRIVEPAGECLKTGDAFARYKNSIHLLLMDSAEYLKELDNLTTKVESTSTGEHE